MLLKQRYQYFSKSQRILSNLGVKVEGKNDAKQDANRYRSVGTDDDMRNVCDRFDDELQQQIDGTLEAGHIYQLGHPGKVLLATGFPDEPIELSAKHLKLKADTSHHPFRLDEIKGLVNALQSPIAVFQFTI